MLRLPPILLVQHVQRLPIKGQIRIVDAVWESPALCIQIDLCFGGLARDAGDEDIILVGAARIGGHGCDVVVASPESGVWGFGK